MTLTQPEITKLVRILGMLGSDHAGERASAGLLATRLLKQRGATWADVIGAPMLASPPPQTRNWRLVVADCLRQRDALTAWEVGFLSKLRGFSSLSPKQRNALRSIAERVLGEVLA
jgi:hypothetical protein